MSKAIFFNIPGNGHVNPSLQQAAERVLNDPIYRQNADNIGKTLHDAGGATRAADLVQALVRKKQSLG